MKRPKKIPITNRINTFFILNAKKTSNEITNNAHLSYQSGKLLMIKTKKEEVL